MIQATSQIEAADSGFLGWSGNALVNGSGQGFTNHLVTASASVSISVLWHILEFLHASLISRRMGNAEKGLGQKNILGDSHLVQTRRRT